MVEKVAAEEIVERDFEGKKPLLKMKKKKKK